MYVAKQMLAASSQPSVLQSLAINGGFIIIIIIKVIYSAPFTN